MFSEFFKNSLCEQLLWKTYLLPYFNSRKVDFIQSMLPRALSRFWSRMAWSVIKLFMILISWSVNGFLSSFWFIFVDKLLSSYHGPLSIKLIFISDFTKAHNNYVQLWEKGEEELIGRKKINISSRCCLTAGQRPPQVLPNINSSFNIYLFSSFGKRSVKPDQKWNALFRQCFQCLGVSDSILTPSGNHLTNGTSASTIDNAKIWQNVAVAISCSHKERNKMSMRKRGSDLEKSVDCLEVIPQFGQKTLTLESYAELQQYIYNVSSHLLFFLFCFSAWPGRKVLSICMDVPK